MREDIGVIARLVVAVVVVAVVGNAGKAVGWNLVFGGGYLVVVAVGAVTVGKS